MPEFHYLDTKYDALKSTANAMSGLAYQLPYLRNQAERIRQERAVADARRILYGEQTRQAAARTKLYESQTAATDLRTEQGRKFSQALIDAGAARADLARQSGTPALPGPATSFSPAGFASMFNPMAARQMAMEQDEDRYIRAVQTIAGTNPERGEAAIRNMQAMVASGMATNPRLAAMVLTGTKLTPHNTPANAVSQDMLDPSQRTFGPILLGAGQTYRQGEGLPVTLGQPKLPNRMPLDERFQLLAGQEAARAAAKIDDYEENNKPGLRSWTFQNVYKTIVDASRQSLGGTNALPSKPLPNKDATRAKANDLIKQYPGDAEAIRKKFRDMYGEDLNASAATSMPTPALNPAAARQSLGMNVPAPGQNPDPLALFPDGVPQRQQPLTASNPQTGNRIRVKSKDGRTGTMDSNEPLPEGWSVVPDPAPPAPQKFGTPAVGEVRSGYRFKGGDPADQNSWEAVSKVLDADTARQYLQRARGDREKARAMAREDGFSF